MKRSLIVGLLAFATVTGCAHAGKKTADMIAYEHARDSADAELVRERNPELFADAQRHYDAALIAHQDNEPEVAEHQVAMADIIRRTAVSRSHVVDRHALAHGASAREAQAKKDLALARKREKIARGAVSRLERIAALMAKQGASKAHDEVAKAMLLIKEAEVVNAREYATAEIERADAALEAATVALESGKLELAIDKSKVAQTEAEGAKKAASPEFNKNKTRLAYEAKRRELFRAASTVDNASARMTEGGVTVTIHKLFASGEVMVDTGRHSTLDGVVKLVQAYPDFKLIVEGHTDSQGRNASNISLSQARADAVVAYLGTKGVDPSRTISTGKASASPIANNKTRAGRAENRRIEVLFVQPSR